MAAWVRGGLILPESTGGEAWGCQDSREGGFQLPVVLASTVLRGNQKQWPARWGHLIQIVERRFPCFVSLSPKDQEMKCHHAQWLIVIVIKNIANIRLALTYAAATQHQPRPQTSTPPNPTSGPLRSTEPPRSS
jgi:hypothetical protein